MLQKTCWWQVFRLPSHQRCWANWMKHSTENWIWKQSGNQGQLLITAIISLFFFFYDSCALSAKLLFLVMFWSCCCCLFFLPQTWVRKIWRNRVRGTLPLCLVLFSNLATYWSHRIVKQPWNQFFHPSTTIRDSNLIPVGPTRAHKFSVTPSDSLGQWPSYCIT